MTMDNLDYLAFLRRKIKLASFAGFEIADDEINPILKPHQRACVKWAVRGGNRALFERFGLGKSVQQLEIVRLVMSKAGGPGLIVCPLGVRQEFKRDGEMLGGYVNLKLPPVEDSTLTNQECWILGRWLADGHRGVRGDFYVSVGPDKLAEFERMAGEHAGTRAVRTAVQFRLKALRHEMIEALNRCGSGAGEKQVPAELLSLNAEKARALLDGYLSGDGHFVSDRGTWMATSISRALLLGMAILAQRVHGTVASLRAGRKAGTKTIDGREVKTRQEWVLSFDAEGARRKAPFILDDGAWKKVRSADPAGEMETWCLRVEEDASFTAEGCIVANCPLQFDIVDRLIERYSNQGETVYDPFGGLMTVPYRAILKGRKGRASELNTAYFFDGVQYLRAAEREVSMPSLFDGLELEESA